MFDPTAFDNMKVVIEGALYDLDLGGDIVITDRNDLMNLAKMSRSFDVTFKLATNTIATKFEMEASLINLAAELMPNTLSANQSGCHIKLSFFLENISKAVDFHKLENISKNVWGETRKVTQSIQYNPMNTSKTFNNVITVEFNRIITEEQMDDLVQMIDSMILTVQNLQSYLKEFA